jgi:citrate lyase beta subunit
VKQPPPRLRRSYFEAPIMDERKWAKVPTIPADVFLADMEDSVPGPLKERARKKVAALVGDPSFFAGREMVCRPNNLSTDWGRDDLEALAEVGAEFILYPKARSAAEVRDVASIFTKHGLKPEIQLLIETPQAVLRVEELSECDLVSGLAFGPGDLAAETRIAHWSKAGTFTDGFLYARSRIVMAARASGLQAIDAAFLGDPKDLNSMCAAAEHSYLMGFDGMISFYPPHVPIINARFEPGVDEIAEAQTIVQRYEEAQAAGRAALTVMGRHVTVHDYRAARQLLTQAAGIRDARRLNAPDAVKGTEQWTSH